MFQSEDQIEVKLMRQITWINRRQQSGPGMMQVNRMRPGYASNISELQDGKLTDGRRAAAGFAAGVTEALVIVTPFEVVKIRLQQQKGVDKALLKYKVRTLCKLTDEECRRWLGQGGRAGQRLPLQTQSHPLCL